MVAAWVAVVALASSLAWFAIERAGREVLAGPSVAWTRTSRRPRPATGGRVQHADGDADRHADAARRTSTAQHAVPAAHHAARASHARRPDRRCRWTAARRSPAGPVGVRCTGSTARLRYAQPAERLDRERQGQRAAAGRGGVHHAPTDGTRVRAECSGGVPVITSDPRSGGGGGGGRRWRGRRRWVGHRAVERFRQGLSTADRSSTATKRGRNAGRARWFGVTAGRGAVPTTPNRRTPMTVARPVLAAVWYRRACGAAGDSRAALSLARRPWSVPTSAGPVVVRGTLPGDLAAVAAAARAVLGARRCCSATSRAVARPSLTHAERPDAPPARGDRLRAGRRGRSPSRPPPGPAWRRRRARAGHHPAARAAGARRLAAARRRAGARRPPRGVRAAARRAASWSPTSRRQGLPLRRILDGIGRTRSHATRSARGCGPGWTTPRWPGWGRCPGRSPAESPLAPRVASG